MDWINDYQLFLLDFDGLLVNTENLHYEAYLRMCAKRGHTLDWTFEDFCKSAHFSSTQLQKDIYKALPALYEEEPNWSILYLEKKKHYLDLLAEKEIELMPGVEAFLLYLDKHKIKRCVVTHSPKEQIEFIREKNPVLKTIKTWITREDYQEAKPHPQPYLVALEKFLKPGEKAIGFEDSPRGIYSLMGTVAKPVMINANPPEKVASLIEEKKISYFPSFAEIDTL